MTEPSELNRDPAWPAANRILIVDDSDAIHADFRKILAPANASDARLREAESLLFGQATAAAAIPLPVYQIDSAFQGQEALQKIELALKNGQPYALAFMDVRMPPGWDGIETITHIWQICPGLPIVLCTAYSDYSWQEMMVRLGHTDNLVVLRKPFEAVEVLQLAHSLTRKWLLSRQVQAQIEKLDALVRSRTQRLEETNQALRQSEDRFARAFHHNPVPLLLLNAAANVCVDVNDSFLQLTGFTRQELAGQAPETLKSMVPPEVQRELQETAAAGHAFRNRQTEITTRDGRHFTVLISAEPLTLQGQPHLLLATQDITERINIESQLRQAQKMEAVGQIAAGVAHDFNNIVAVIQGHAELQLNLGHTDPSLLESLQEISQAAGRAAALTRQLLAFSRKQMLRPSPIHIPDLLASLGKMLQRIIGENIRLRIQCADHLPPVLADQVNLEQIVINLAVNARDAMPRGGPLTITASLADVDAHYKEKQPDALIGKFICLSVADEGIGMEPAVRRKIFEPFFTTKGVGKGTGMGLATVYGIVKQHQGWIEVESLPNAGSVFKVYLPVAGGEVEKEAASGRDFLRAEGVKSQTILIVEDEVSLREMAAKILRRLGYQTLTAADGPEALQLWPAHRGKIDLLFTDMVMPGGLTGKELAERLLHDQPGLRVIYSTGYSVDFSHPDIKLDEGLNLLLKPYDATALTRVVKAALAAPANAQST